MPRFLIGPIEITILENVSKTRTMRLGSLSLTFSEGLKVATTLPDDKDLPFISPKQGFDRHNNPTNLKSQPTVAVSDPSMLQVIVPDPTTPDDLFSGVIRPIGPLGTAQVTFTDSVDAAQPLIAIVDVTIVAGDIVNLGQPTFGPLRDQPTT